MKERILEFLKAENKSSAQLADEISVQPSGISHILSGRNNPSLDFILKMLEKYKYLSTEWLLFGQGTMYKDTGIQGLFDADFISKSENIKEIAHSGPTSEKKSTLSEEKEKTESEKERESTLHVEKIVWFYNDDTFREYFPGK